MSIIVNISYFNHSGSLVLEDKNVGFSPFIGQIIENKFLKNNSCTGVFYVNKIDTYKDSKNSYVSDVSVWETNKTFLEDGEAIETVEEYYKGKLN